MHSGQDVTNFRDGGALVDEHRHFYSLVLQYQFNDSLRYVFQHDFGIEANRDADTREWRGSDVHIPQQGGLWLEIGIRQQDCDREDLVPRLQMGPAHEAQADDSYSHGE